MDYCAKLGFTLENVEGVDEIKPQVLGMRGQEVDFDKIEIGQAPSALNMKSNRVNLGAIPDESKTLHVPTEAPRGDELMRDFIELGEGEGQDFEALNYNHKLRRKLRRAIIAADIKKELLVREKAIEHLQANNMEVPEVLTTPGKVVSERQPRALENGKLETAKQERVRQRVELTEFNNAARVLRKQAKEKATYAGLRIYAELTGQIPRREEPTDMKAEETSATAVTADDPAEDSDTSGTDTEDSDSRESFDSE
jgi:hypothetical protein